MCFGNIFSFKFKKSIFCLFFINSSMLKKSNFLFYFVSLLASRSVCLFYNFCCFFLKEIKFFENLAIIKIIGHFLFWFFATFPFTGLRRWNSHLTGWSKKVIFTAKRQKSILKIASFCWKKVIFLTWFLRLFRCLKNLWSQTYFSVEGIYCCLVDYLF